MISDNLEILFDGLTHEEAAQKIGVTRQAVGKLLKSETQPSAGVIISICKSFGVSADWLLGVQRPEKLKTERFMGAVYNLNEFNIGYAISRGHLKEWCEIMKSDFMSIFHSAEDIKDE